MSDFDKSGRWRSLDKIWNYGRKGSISRTKAEIKIQDTLRKEAEKAWNSVVNDACLADAVMCDAVLYQKNLEEGNYPIALSKLIRAAQADWGSYVPELEETQTAKKTEPPPLPVPIKPQSKKATETEAAFRFVWDQWVHSSEYKETVDAGSSAFREVCRTNPVEDVVTACLHYIRCIKTGLEGDQDPHTMRYFLLREPRDYPGAWWVHYLHRSKVAPTDAAVAEFDLVWKIYPNFRGRTEKKRLRGRSYYLRSVPEGLRPAFLCAVHLYARDRRKEEDDLADREKYTLSFSNFVESWQELYEKRWPRELAYYLAPRLSDYLVTQSIPRDRVSGEGNWIPGALKGAMQPPRRLTPLQAIELVAMQVYGDAGPPEPVPTRRLLQEAYQDAGQAYGAMLQSSFSAGS